MRYLSDFDKFDHLKELVLLRYCNTYVGISFINRLLEMKSITYVSIR